MGGVVHSGLFQTIVRQWQRVSVLQVVTLLLSLSLYCASHKAYAEPASDVLTFCADQNFWYPFTFVEDDEVTGIHVDIIRHALTRLDYELEVQPLPWLRCLRESELGNVDGIITASWSEDREDFLRFPEDASVSESSSLAVSHVRYVVVVLADSDYEYQGELQTLPQPVRVPRGYSIARDIRQQGLDVDDEAPADDNNLMKLLRDRKGSVIATPDVLDTLLSRHEFNGRFRVSEMPVTSKDYFLPFSRNGRISREQAREIWQEISRIRNNPEIMRRIQVSY